MITIAVCSFANKRVSRVFCWWEYGLSCAWSYWMLLELSIASADIWVNCMFLFKMICLFDQSPFCHIILFMIKVYIWMFLWLISYICAKYSHCENYSWSFEMLYCIAESIPKKFILSALLLLACVMLILMGLPYSLTNSAQYDIVLSPSTFVMFFSCLFASSTMWLFSSYELTVLWSLVKIFSWIWPVSSHAVLGCWCSTITLPVDF